MKHRVPAVLAFLAAGALGAQAPVKPPATSPGGGPQRWNVVDGVRKYTVPGYLARESLQPLPPVAPKAPKAVAPAHVKRTRAVLEDAVFEPLNKRTKFTDRYKYKG